MTMPISRRWLEGWELIVPSVGIAALAAWLALPRPTLPNRLPLPTLDPTSLEQARDRLVEQAEQARRKPLPYEIRAIGERYRQLGRAMQSGIALSIDERGRYRAQLEQQLRAFGPEPLLELRAIQTELFVQALSSWEKTGQQSTELSELGGDFLDVFRPPHSTSRHLPLTLDERRAIFLLRWTDLAGLTENSEFRLEPSWLLLTATLRLRRPLAEANGRTLAAIERVMTVDPEYPGDVARGLVFAQTGSYGAAAEHFRRFLAEHPNGPYSTRARHHLQFATRTSEPPESAETAEP
jgi:hypothetical protein